MMNKLNLSNYALMLDYNFIGDESLEFLYAEHPNIK